MKQKFSIILFCLLALSGRAMAQDGNTLCLYCEEPDKTYRCSVIGSKQVNPQITKLYCLIKTAKEQNHARCRVKQNTDKLCVGGTEVTYLYEGPNIPGLTTKTNRNDEITKLSRQNDKVKARHEPSTLVELTQKSLGNTKNNFKKAGDNTKKAIKKTGKVIEKGAKNIGGAVKGVGDFLFNTTTTTVKCIFTLFNKCDNTKANSVKIPQESSVEQLDRQIILENRMIQKSAVPQPSPNNVQPSYDAKSPHRVVSPPDSSVRAQ